MTLLITVFAAVASTVVWYNCKTDIKIGTLCLIYWGAALMWFVDAFAEYIKQGSACFYPELTDMLNDTFLGLSVAAFGLLIWIVILLINDPAGKIKKKLIANKSGEQL